MTDDALPSLPFAVRRLVLEVEAIDVLRLPRFAGSALRGAYGRALRRLTCMTGAPSCDGCRLVQSCPFPRLFEPPPRDLSHVGLRANAFSPTPPFAIEPPDLGGIPIAAGRHWRFGVRLFGHAWRDATLVIEAFRRALLSGLTTARASGRLTRVILDTADGGHDLYDPENHRLSTCEEVPQLLFKPASRLSLEMITPLRLQSNGRRLCPSAFTARRLGADIARRARLLSAVCADSSAYASARQWPVKDWLDDLEAARTSADLHWMDWERFSTRQKRAICTGGWLGTLAITGLTPAGSALFQIGSVIGLGKECVFGFGQYSIEDNTPRTYGAFDAPRATTSNASGPSVERVLVVGTDQVF
ncbi:MAG: CRISPR system precrRNA processing endoribonuclease RAMP protein Cas6 [Sphingomonadales bacterium]|nr:MAG: CRISPR system precrRNA processing endoribonuclease RAMP protein Cas6 [Sphingomonadales bacterium]